MKGLSVLHTRPPQLPLPIPPLGRARTTRRRCVRSRRWRSAGRRGWGVTWTSTTPSTPTATPSLASRHALGACGSSLARGRCGRGHGAGEGHAPSAQRSTAAQQHGGGPARDAPGDPEQLRSAVVLRSSPPLPPAQPCFPRPTLPTLCAGGLLHLRQLRGGRQPGHHPAPAAAQQAVPRLPAGAPAVRCCVV